MRKILFVSIILFYSKSDFAQNPTWAQNVAPVFYAHCTGCHHPGGLGPSSLITYSDALNTAYALDNAVSNKIMPPWTPDPAYRHFAHERVLTDSEIAAIHNWVMNGFTEGDITQAPAQPVYNNITQLSMIDFSVQIPAYTVAGTGDVLRNFPIPTNFLQDEYITAIEVIPGNSQIVHHAVVFQDTTNLAFSLDSADPGPGYSGTTPGSPASMLVAGYTPGTQPYYTPVGTGIRLYRNTNLIIQIHYPDGTQGMVDSTRVNFKLTPIPQREITQWVLLNTHGLVNGPLTIPPDSVVTFNERDTITSDLTFISVFPHMHLIGRNIKSWANTPVPNDTIPFINIPNWQFHWQGSYMFPNTVKVPNGSILQAIATYDNTVNNPDNPFHPPQTITQGNATTNEMMLVFIGYMPYQNGDENIIVDRRIIPLGSTKLCAGHPVVLETIEGTGYSYQWYYNGNAINNSDSASLSATLPGNYCVQISLGPNSVFSDTISVTTGSVPSANITPSGSGTFCTGNTITLSADTGSNYSYQWFKDSLLLWDASNATFTSDSPGVFFVQVSGDCNAVSAPVTVTEVVCSSIHEFSDNSVTITPNPSNGNFEINWAGLNTEVYRISVFDLQGRIVYEAKGGSNHKQIISLRETSSGSYILQLNTSSGTVHNKLLVEN